MMECSKQKKQCHGGRLEQQIDATSQKLQHGLTLPKTSNDKARLIQVIDQKSNIDESEDEEPPEILFSDSQEQPTLMQIMMEQASQARAEQAKSKVEKQVNAAKHPCGLKKGFLTQKSKPKTSKKTEKRMIPTISSQPHNNLKLDEVQKAMTPSWMTPYFTNRIASNPELASAMMNPRFTSLLEDMQHNPKEAIQKCQRECPQLMQALRQVFGVLGEHFTQLGNQQQPPLIQPSLGPFAEAAIKKSQAVPLSSKEQSKVNQICSDPQVAALLMDPVFQRTLQECSDPILFRKHLQDPETGPKIQILVKAGVFQIQR